MFAEQPTSLDKVTLYGVPHSLYTGKTRSYLRKQGIPYRERAPDEHFATQIVPQLGRAILPVVELGDGTLLQDTVDILDWFEDRGVPVSARPPGPRQRVLAHIAELFAVVSLTRHAMHYRWNFSDKQDHFLRHAFAGGAGPRNAEALMARMQSYLPLLGVTEATIPAIEHSYDELLDLLDAHFDSHPYLFGGQPSLGDYGLLGPLYAHLGRDPVPADLMKRRAPAVWRWVERMNAPDPDIPEFPDYPAAYLEDDGLPEALVPLFRHMAQELFPELVDTAAAIAAHVAEHDPAAGALVGERPQNRMIGMVETSFRGIDCQIGVQPYVLYLWQRVTDAARSSSETAGHDLREWLENVGLNPLLDTERPVRVERRDHREVWGERSGS